MPAPARSPGTASSSSAPRCRTPASARPRRSFSSRSEEHTSELQSLMRISYAVFCLKKKNNIKINKTTQSQTINNLKSQCNITLYNNKIKQKDNYKQMND